MTWRSLMAARALTLSAAAATDQPLRRWAGLHLSGELWAQYDHLAHCGLRANSPFPNAGGQHQEQFDLAFRRPQSGFSRLEGQLAGRFNRSDLAGGPTGFIPKRLAIQWEKGDAFAPLCATLGDCFVLFTPRTVQRSLNGVSAEFRPASPYGNLSVLVFNGAEQTPFRGFEYNDLMLSGLSAALFGRAGGALRANWVHSYQGADPGTSWTLQTYSLAGYIQAQAPAGQQVDLEAKSAYASGEGAADPGYFLSLAGRGKSPLTHDLTFQRYPRGFADAGAAISAYQQNLLARLGWRFASRVRADARFQRTTDGLSAFRVNNQTLGLNANGPLPLQRLAGWTFRWDGFGRFTADKPGSVDRTLYSQALGLNASLDPQWQGKLSYQVHYNNGRLAGAQASLNALILPANGALKLWRMETRARHSLTYRQQNRAGGNRELGAGLDLALRRGAHGGDPALDLFGQQQQEADTDLSRQSLGINCGYRHGAGDPSLSLTLEQRLQDSATDNTAGPRVGARYVRQLELDPQPLATPDAAPPAQEPAPATLGLSRFLPNMPLDQARS